MYTNSTRNNTKPNVKIARNKFHLILDLFVDCCINFLNDSSLCCGCAPTTVLIIANLRIDDCGAWWLSGKFSALRPEGRRFETHSSRHVERWAPNSTVT